MNAHKVKKSHVGNQIVALENIQENSTRKNSFLEFYLDMNNLEAGLFFTTQTISITYKYIAGNISNPNNYVFHLNPVFVQAGSSVINARKVFGMRLFGHNVNKEENETFGRTVWRNYRRFLF